MYIFKLNEEDYSKLNRVTIRKQGQPDPKREPASTPYKGGNTGARPIPPLHKGGAEKAPRTSAAPTSSQKSEGKGLGWFLLLGLCFLIGVIL